MGRGIFIMVVGCEARLGKKSLLDSRVEPLWTLDAVIAMQQSEMAERALLCRRTRLLSEQS